MIAALPYPVEEPTLTLDVLVKGVMEIAEDDPVLLLAQAAAWLIPWVFEEQEQYEAEPGETAACLEIVYEHFPDYLPGIIREYHHGAGFDLHSSIGEAMRTEALVSPYEMDDYESWSHYMPYFLYGVDLDNQEDAGWEDFTDILDACRLDRREPYQGFKVAEVLIASLKSQHNHVYDNVAMLLYWLYGQTGNAFTDMSYDEFLEGGWEPFYWSQFHYARQVQQEATDLFEQAMLGRDALANDGILHECLLKNARHVRKLARKKGDKFNGSKCKLQWTPYFGDADKILSPTQAHALLVRTWRVHPDEQN